MKGVFFRKGLLQNVWGKLLFILKNRDYFALTMAFLYIVFRFLLSPLFAVPTILILCVLKPFVWIKVGGLPYGRIGHLALDTDLFVRRRQLGIYPDGPYYCFISNPNNLANRQLLNMWKRVIPVYESRVLSWLFYGMLPILKRTPFYQDLPLDSNEYYEFNNAKPSLYFTPDEIKKGHEHLSQMGVDLDKDEYVCIFARDSTYLKDTIPYNNWDYHNKRNSDIDSFIRSIKYLIENNYTVIRVGSVVEKPISYSHPRLIDYSVSQHRCEFLDIFLVATCKFFIGGLSGICDVATLFDIPRVSVEIGEFGFVPIGKASLYIPKKIKSKKTGQYLKFKEAFEIKLEPFSKNIQELGLELENNSPQDILEITQEMVSRIQGTFQYLPDEEKLMRQFQDLWSQSNVIGKNVPTPIGIEWLKKNRALYF